MNKKKITSMNEKDIDNFIDQIINNNVNSLTHNNKGLVYPWVYISARSDRAKQWFAFYKLASKQNNDFGLSLDVLTILFNTNSRVYLLRKLDEWTKIGAIVKNKRQNKVLFFSIPKEATLKQILKSIKEKYGFGDGKK